MSVTLLGIIKQLYIFFKGYITEDREEQVFLFSVLIMNWTRPKGRREEAWASRSADSDSVVKQYLKVSPCVRCGVLRWCAVRR